MDDLFPFEWTNNVGAFSLVLAWAMGNGHGQTTSLAALQVLQLHCFHLPISLINGLLNRGNMSSMGILIA